MKKLALATLILFGPFIAQAELNPLFKELDKQYQASIEQTINEIVANGVDICAEAKVDFSDEARSERDVRHMLVGVYFNEASRLLDVEKDIDLATDGTLKKLEEAYIGTIFEGKIVALCSEHLDDK